MKQKSLINVLIAKQFLPPFSANVTTILHHMHSQNDFQNCTITSGALFTFVLFLQETALLEHWLTKLPMIHC